MDQRTLLSLRQALRCREARKRGSLVEPVVAMLVVLGLIGPVLLVWLTAGHVSVQPAQLPPIPWASFAITLAVAAVASFLAVVLGGAMAAILVLTDFPGRRACATFALLPFVCSPMVWSLGQVYCYGPGGIAEQWVGGMWRAVRAWSDMRNYLPATLVLAQIHAPLAMLIIGRGLQRLHHAGFQSAQLFLGPLGMIRWTAGAVLLETTTAFLLAVALSLGNFAVPLVLQCPLYATEVYIRMGAYLDHRGSLWIALPLVATAVSAAAGMAVAERRRRYTAGTTAPPVKVIRLGRKRWLVGGPLVLYLALVGLLPLVAIVYECRSPYYFVEALSAAADELENSLWIAAAASILAVLAGLVVGIWAATRARLGIDVLTIVPVGLPPMLLGLAYLLFYNHTWLVDLDPLGNTSLVLILALTARAWPFTSRIVASGRRRIAQEWYEAARLGGLHGHARWRWITLPLLANDLAAGAAVAFILAVNDTEISQMLSVPGTGTLTLRLFTFLHFGPTHVAANLAVLQLLLAVVPLWIYFLLSHRTLQIV